MRKAAETPKEKIRNRKKLRSSIGVRQRNSHQMKTTNRAPDSTSAVRIGAEVQPVLWAKVSPSSNDTIIPVERTAPVQSKLVLPGALSDSQLRSTAKVASTPARPRGMFNKEHGPPAQQVHHQPADGRARYRAYPNGGHDQADGLPPVPAPEKPGS